MLIVCFGSFQDYLGKNEAGGIKVRNEWVHSTHWDSVIFDEYHYGAWREIAMKGAFNEFDLNVFFSANGLVGAAKFTYENEVQKWLDLIRGSFSETTIDNLKMGAQKPPLRFSHAPLLNVLTYTFWFLPSVASCFSMKNLLEERQNKFYFDYDVIVAAGTSAGIGVEALPPIFKAMGKFGIYRNQ